MGREGFAPSQVLFRKSNLGSGDILPKADLSLLKSSCRTLVFFSLIANNSRVRELFGEKNCNPFKKIEFATDQLLEIDQFDFWCMGAG